MSTGPKLVIRFPPTNRAAELQSSPGPSETDTQSQSQENDLDEDVEVEDDLVIPDVVPVKRGRGRGRPRGSTSRGGRAGSGTPGPSTLNTTRGRPAGTRGRGRGTRGRGRGAARGAGRTGSVSLNDDDDIEEGIVDYADDSNEIEEQKDSKKDKKSAPVGAGKPSRKVLGQMYVIDGDEFVTEDDPKGDEKIDKWGNLLGGRRFKQITFTLPNRHPSRQYMLAIEAARASGYRDSLYYFRRNPLALKLNLTQPEKDHLISIGKLNSHMKTRAVTVLTARSAFKQHGSKMVIDGKWVVDDYYEDKALALIAELGLDAKPGDLVGNMFDITAAGADGGESRQNKSLLDEADFGTSGGGGSIYRPGGPTTIFSGSGYGPFSDGPLNPVRKALLNRDAVNEENWMWKMAMRVREADGRWRKTRDGLGAGVKPGAGITPEVKANVANCIWDVGSEDPADGPTKKKQKVAFTPSEPSLPLGVYEPHSGTVFFRKVTQPTRARLECVPGSPVVLGGTKTGGGAWGLAYVDTVMELPSTTRKSSPDESESYLDESQKIWKNRESLLRACGLGIDGRELTMSKKQTKKGGGDDVDREQSVIQMDVT